MKLWELTTKRYSKDIGFPPGIEMPKVGAVITYSGHARTEARADRLQQSHLPSCLPAGFDVVEVSTLAGKPVKWVVRFALAARPGYDIVIVLNPNYYASTLWLNASEDHHATLKRFLYADPAA